MVKEEFVSPLHNTVTLAFLRSNPDTVNAINQNALKQARFEIALF